MTDETNEKKFPNLDNIKIIGSGPEGIEAIDTITGQKIKIMYENGKPILLKDYIRTEKKPEVLVKDYRREQAGNEAAEQKLPENEKPVELPYSVTGEAKPRKLPYAANIPGESHPPEPGHVKRLSYIAQIPDSKEGLEKIASGAGSSKADAPAKGSIIKAELKKQVLEFLKGQKELLSKTYSWYNIEKLADAVVNSKDNIDRILGLCQSSGEHGERIGTEGWEIGSKIHNFVEPLTIDPSKYSPLDLKILDAVRKVNPNSRLLVSHKPAEDFIDRLDGAIKQLEHIDPVEFRRLDLDNPGFGKYIRLDMFDEDTRKQIFREFGDYMLSRKGIPVKRPLRAFLLSGDTERLVDVLTNSIYSVLNDSERIKETVITIGKKRPELLKAAASKMAEKILSDQANSFNSIDEDYQFAGLIAFCRYANASEPEKTILAWVKEQIKQVPGIDFQRSYTEVVEQIEQERGMDWFEAKASARKFFWLKGIDFNKIDERADYVLGQALYQTAEEILSDSKSSAERFCKLEQFKQRFGFYGGIQEIIQKSLDTYDCTHKSGSNWESELKESVINMIQKGEAKPDNAVAYIFSNNLHELADCLEGKEGFPEQELKLLLKNVELSERQKKAVYDAMDSWMDKGKFDAADAILTKLNDPNKDDIINRGFEKTFIFW